MSDSVHQDGAFRPGQRENFVRQLAQAFLRFFAAIGCGTHVKTVGHGLVWAQFKHGSQTSWEHRVRSACRASAGILLCLIVAACLVSSTRAAERSPYDALDVLNRQRAARGLRPYVRDEGLTRAAIAACHYRAKYRIAGHSSNDFGFLPRGVTAPVAGCACWSPGDGFGACAAYENWARAGAAWCRGKDNRVYCHLFVK